MQLALYFRSRRCGQLPAHSWSAVTCHVLMCVPLHMLVVSLSRVHSFTEFSAQGVLAYFEYFFSTEFLIQCDGCWEWGSVWRAGLVAREGFWGVLATWVWGRQLQPPGS